MTIDIIESLLAREGVDSDDLAARFAKSYRWSRGYGPATARMLKRIGRGEAWGTASRSVYRDGSFGNGAAMRAPVIGLFYANRPGELVSAARRSAEVTHAHELGIAGAVLIARATAAAASGGTTLEVLRWAAEGCELQPFLSRLLIAEQWLKSQYEASAVDVKRQLGSGIAATESCVTALYLALRFRERAFLEMQRMVAMIGGDADTVGAMAGAIWGAANGGGRLPREQLARLEEIEQLSQLALELYRVALVP